MTSIGTARITYAWLDENYSDIKARTRILLEWSTFLFAFTNGQMLVDEGCLKGNFQCVDYQRN